MEFLCLGNSILTLFLPFLELSHSHAVLIELEVLVKVTKAGEVLVALWTLVYTVINESNRANTQFLQPYSVLQER